MVKFANNIFPFHQSPNFYIWFVYKMLYSIDRYLDRTFYTNWVASLRWFSGGWFPLAPHGLLFHFSAYYPLTSVRIEDTFYDQERRSFFEFRLELQKNWHSSSSCLIWRACLVPLRDFIFYISDFHCTFLTFVFPSSVCVREHLIISSQYSC